MGSFGKVFLCVDLKKKTEYAMKSMKKNRVKKDKNSSALLQEVEVLKSLKHRHIVRVIELI